MLFRSLRGRRVRIVTGDTKVVDRGKGDGLFVTTLLLGGALGYLVWWGAAQIPSESWLASLGTGALRVVGTFADERIDARIEPKLAAVDAFSGVVRCPNAKPHAALTCEITASTGDGNWVRSGQADLKPSAGETP
mgnify:CR=1 FL=1